MWKYVVCGVLVAISVALIIWMVYSWCTSSSSGYPQKLDLTGGSAKVSLVYNKHASNLNEGQYGVYFSPRCGWCNKLKQDLAAQSVSKPVEVLMFDVSGSQAHQQGLMQVSPSGGVPCTVQKIGGAVKLVQSGYNADLAKKMCQ